MVLEPQMKYCNKNLKLEDVEGTNLPNKQHSSNKQQQHSAAKLHDKLDKTEEMVRFSKLGF